MKSLYRYFEVVTGPAKAVAGRWSDNFRRRPWWSLVALASVAGLAACLYLWGLSKNGMGNSYYAAAIKSGSVSWKAFFFGSLDPGSFITVDKLPASLWAPELFARVFGFSSWSILMPQALAGVASVLIVYRLVRRWMGEVAALLAGVAMALTPIAVVMFRFNNPDAFLTLFLLLAAWALWSALDKGSTWKLAGAGALVGVAFTGKMLEALVVLPAFALVYLVCGRPRLVRRILQVVAAAAALIVSSGWWIAIVELWPKVSRPYIGGSSNNSVLNLIFSRSAGYLGSAGGPNFSGNAGWLRMFNQELGGQISWLIPLALVGLVAGLWTTLRRPRTDRQRAGFLLWGGWSLLFLLAFSFAKGVLHPYYTVVLAPSLAALVGGGGVVLWQIGRSRVWLSWLLPLAVVGTAAWSAALLGRTPGYAPGLSTAVIAIGVVAAVALVLALAGVVKARTLSFAAVVLAAVCVLAGPFAYSASTISRSVTGSLAAAGPASAVVATAGGPGNGSAIVAGLGDGSGPGPGGDGAASGGPPSGAPPSGAPAGGGQPNQAYSGPGAGSAGSNVPIPSGGSPAGAGQMGGPGSDTQVDQGLVSYLVARKGSATYLVAVEQSQAAEPIILATGQPVMAMGGFNGSDPAPTLAQLEALVASGKLHYVLLTGATAGIGGGGGGAAGGVQTFDASSIEQWVTTNGTLISSTEYGGQAGFGTLYYLK